MIIKPGSHVTSCCMHGSVKLLSRLLYVKLNTTISMHVLFDTNY